MGRRQTLTDQDILARARPVFLHHGLHATTREIAAAVGLTWGALAFRFGNKRRLFEQAMAQRNSAAAALAASFMKGLVQAMDDDTAGRLRAHGLTLAQRKALVVLNQGRTITPIEMSRALELDAGATTRLLDRLLAKKLCLGRCGGGDQRCVQLQITELGRSALDATEGMKVTILRHWFTSAGEGELEALCSLLSRLTAAGLQASASPSDGTDPTPTGGKQQAGAADTFGVAAAAACTTP